MYTMLTCILLAKQCSRRLLSTDRHRAVSRSGGYAIKGSNPNLCQRFRAGEVEASQPGAMEGHLTDMSHAARDGERASEGGYITEGVILNRRQRFRARELEASQPGASEGKEFDLAPLTKRTEPSRMSDPARSLAPLLFGARTLPCAPVSSLSPLIPFHPSCVCGPALVFGTLSCCSTHTL